MTVAEPDFSFLALPAFDEAEKEDEKPPLHVLSGVMDSILKALPRGGGIDDLLLMALLVVLFNSEREDRFGLIVAIGYLLLFGHDGSTA